jgi:glycerol-3-phosphate acyltransferase PlsY
VDTSLILLTVGVSYLIGSISFSRLVVRLFAPEKDLGHIKLDVPGTESKFEYTAAGGMAVGMRMGSRFGCLTGILDMLKAALPTLLFKLLYPDQPYFLIAGLAAMVGHIWPVFYRFKGGRGYSAVYGSLLVVDWLGAVVTSCVGMLIGTAVLRDLMIAYLGSMWLIVPWLWLRTHDLAYVAYAVALNVLFMVALIPDLRQAIALRKAGTTDLQSEMSAFPMAREMLRMQEMAQRLFTRRQSKS